MAIHSLQAFQVLGQALREEFAERLREVEQERDDWKAKFEQAEQDGNSWSIKYQQEQLKVQNLEALQRAAQAQTTDIVGRTVESPLKTNGSAQLKDESPANSSQSNTSNPEKYADLERRYKVLQRKYDQLDSWYKEAKSQLSSVKAELATKTEAWRKWLEWWNAQRNHLRIKSTSPTKKQDEDVNFDGQTEHSRNEDEMDVVGRDTVLEGLSRPTNSRDSTEINKFMSRTAHTKRTHSNDEIDALPKTTLGNAGLALPSSATRPRVFEHITKAMETEVQSTSKPETTEILDVPESPVTNVTRVALPLEGGQMSPITITSSPATSPSNKRTTPNERFKSWSTRTSAPKGKKREYPNMKHFTEDGTDGFNPQPDSQNCDEDDGMIEALLEGRARPPPLAIAIPLPRPKTAPPAPSTATSTSRPSSKGRTRELIEIDSDSGRSSSGGDSKRQKTEQVRSEPRARGNIFSPDHATKNKGKGRYSESYVTRNIGDPPRIQDFTIDPANNQGVSHPFNDVVRGKDARRSLPATVCQECSKFHELHGPTAGASACKHVQQVSRHRHQWEPEPKPPGFWNSHFPTEEEIQQNRAEAERLEAERVKKMAEEAARKDGRWKWRDR